MPIYEYICRSCEERFSLLQSINAKENDALCPRCSSKEVKKVMSSFSCAAGGSAGCSPTVPSRGFSGGG